MYELRNWRRLDNVQRVRIIGRIGREAGDDPRLRRLAVAIFREYGIEPRDYAGQAAALLDWIQRHVYFINERDEVLQDPAYTLDMQDDGTLGGNAHGDCDDFTMLFIALCSTIGLATRAVTSGRMGRRTVRWVEGVGRPPAARYSHIYAAVAPRPFSNGYNAKTWSFADGTVSGAPLGWDVVQARRSDPQRGGNDLGDPGDDVDVAGMTGKGALQLVAVGVLTGLVLKAIDRFWVV